MLTVSGRIEGLVMIYFEPTQARFKDAFGTVIISGPLAVRPDAQGNFSAQLYSNSELSSLPPAETPWLWRVTEISRDDNYAHYVSKRLTFTFKPDPGSYSYAQLRTSGEGLP